MYPYKSLCCVPTASLYFFRGIDTFNDSIASSLKLWGGGIVSITPAQSQSFAPAWNSVAFAACNQCRSPSQRNGNSILSSRYYICLGWNWNSFIDHSPGISCSSCRATRPRAAEMEWRRNSRHCGLEAGRLLLIRLKQWMLALHFFSHSICLAL